MRLGCPAHKPDAMDACNSVDKMDQCSWAAAGAQVICQATLVIRKLASSSSHVFRSLQDDSGWLVKKRGDGAKDVNPREKPPLGAVFNALLQAL